jgi:hypothetical protein
MRTAFIYIGNINHLNFDGSLYLQFNYEKVEEDKAKRKRKEHPLWHLIKTVVIFMWLTAP